MYSYLTMSHLWNSLHFGGPILAGDVLDVVAVFFFSSLLDLFFLLLDVFHLFVTFPTPPPLSGCLDCFLFCRNQACMWKYISCIYNIVRSHTSSGGGGRAFPCALGGV